MPGGVRGSRAALTAPPPAPAASPRAASARPRRPAPARAATRPGARPRPRRRRSRCMPRSSSSRVGDGRARRQPARARPAPPPERRDSCSAASRVAALVEVEPRAQRELLARQRHVAPGQQRRQPLLRRQRRSAWRPAAAARAPPPSGRRPPARRDPYPTRVASAMLRAHLADVGVARRQPVRVDRAVEDRERVGRECRPSRHGRLSQAWPPSLAAAGRRRSPSRA